MSVDWFAVCTFLFSAQSTERLEWFLEEYQRCRVEEEQKDDPDKKSIRTLMDSEIWIGAELDRRKNESSGGDSGVGDRDTGDSDLANSVDDWLKSIDCTVK